MTQISEMEEEIKTLRSMTQQLGQKHDSGIDTLREEVSNKEEQYEDLLRHYHRMEDKSKREQKEAKAQKDRLRDVEDLLVEMMEKIAKLPTTTKDLKYRKIVLIQFQSEGVKC